MLVLQMLSALSLATCTVARVCRGLSLATGTPDATTDDADDINCMLQQRVPLMLQSTVNPDTGAWDAKDLKGRPHDGLNTCLAEGIAHFLKNKSSTNDTSLGDFGAGSGVYSKFWKGHGIDVHCVDGNPVIENVSGGLCSQMDLGIEQAVPQVDWAISLEVAEHIPAPHEAAYLHNLKNANKFGIIISWAHVGQKGNGHVNCRDAAYVIEKFAGLGYKLDQEATDQLRSASTCHGAKPRAWNGKNFKNNLLVFIPQD